ncbi:MAG: sortase [Chloroflexi bacterium]|nr:sortase [Chloroflexota bacterium]MYF79928.1 sortase [Chloroflexota bacterium]MYK61685.1 sortase [Chloroflexota bacterium]
MSRISRLARPVGFVVAIVGIAMVAISGYYLYAYMQSGSDADLFNVDAAAPEDQLVLLGQSIPKPQSRNAAARGSVEVEPVTRVSAKTVESSNALQEVTDVDSAETVSITSVLPGGVFTAPERRTGSVASKTVGEFDGSAGPGQTPSMMSAAEISDTSRSDVEAAPVVPTSVLLDTFASIYPGGSMNPRYWSEPHWAGNLPFGGPTIPEGFIPVDASDTSLLPDDAERGVRMRIPAIDLDGTVSELEILDLGDSRAWSTPDNVVGHIPTTANPGEAANGWYFGHLDNFISNEGDIFRRLPEISEMISNDPVDIFITTSDAEYMYRVTHTRQLHRDELSLTESSNAQISLVTCWPFRVYDHRIVVSAVLIAVKPLQEA